jgi:hypothetical protein
MGEFIGPTELRVGDVFRVRAHLGKISKSRRVTTVRVLRTSTTYAVIVARDAQGNLDTLDVREDVEVERLSLLNDLDVASILHLTTNGDTVSFSRFDHALYA